MADPSGAGGTPPAAGGGEIHHEHRDLSGGWLRPTVFGAMDGLVSNFALIAGVAGASASRSDIALAGLAGLVSGAFSMATGEYISVQSQNESSLAELDVERDELANNAASEQAELAHMYEARGLEPALAAEVARQLSRDPGQALRVHAQEELGIDPTQLPSAWVAAGSSLASFGVGAFLPLVPYLFGTDTLWVSGVLTAVTLFLVGAFTSRLTSRTWLYSGVRQLALGACAAAVAFGVGSLFHATTG